MTSLFDDEDRKKLGGQDFSLGDQSTKRDLESGSDDSKKDSKDKGSKGSRFKLPFSKKDKNEGEDDWKLQVGRDVESAPASPFGEAYTINKENDVPTEKELKKQKKGKSGLTLGQKYGGRRRTFGFMMIILIVIAFLVLFNTIRSGSFVSKSDVEDEVSEAITNETSQNFPTGLGAMRVEAFTRVYGTWDYKTPSARAADLSPFLAPGVDPQAGWNTKGQQKVIYSAVSPEPEIVGKNRAVYDATYQIEDGTWRCVKVPVYAYKPTDKREGPTDSWSFSVSANPAPVSCPLSVGVPDFEANEFDNTDSEAADTLREQFFPGFFSAWATSNADTLRQYMAPNVKTFGLGGAYKDKPDISEVQLPIGSEEEKAQPDKLYNAYVTVKFVDQNDSEVAATYKVPVSYTGTRWQVMGEPEAIVQDPKASSSGSKIEGKDTSEDAEQEEYATPDPQNDSDQGDEDTTVPPPSDGGE